MSREFLHCFLTDCGMERYEDTLWEKTGFTDEKTILECLTWDSALIDYGK